MKILLTHATGFLGSYLLEELSRQELPLKAATRPTDPIENLESDFLIDGLDLESLTLNLQNLAEVLEAAHDVQIIFHLDQIAPWEEPNLKKRTALQLQAWQNLSKACQRFPIEKLIVLGENSNLPLSPQGYLCSQEGSSQKNPKKKPIQTTPLEKAYETSLKAGLPLIRVYPAALVGAREKLSTPLGQYLKKVIKSKKAPYVDSGFSVISASAAAKGLVLCAKRGEVGRRYTLMQENFYFLSFLQGLEKILKTPIKKSGLPFWLARLRRTFDPYFLKELKRGLLMEAKDSQELGLPKGDIWAALGQQLAEY